MKLSPSIFTLHTKLSLGKTLKSIKKLTKRLENQLLNLKPNFSNQIWLRGSQKKLGRISAGSKITSMLAANDIILCGTEMGLIKVSATNSSNLFPIYLLLFP